MNLTYKAVDPSGKSVSDVIEAPDIRAAAEQLHRMGLLVTDISPATAVEGRRASDLATSSSTKLPLKTAVLITKQMAMLLKSGSGVVPALEAVKAQLPKPEHAAVIGSLVRDLQEGLSLSEAMAKHPRSFDASYRAIIAAGEASARLPDIFSRLAHILRQRKVVRNRVIGALVYPALLLSICAGVTLLLLLFIIPRFAVLFTTLRMDLPASTELLLGLSTMLRERWGTMIVVVIGGAGGVAGFILSARGRQIIIDYQTDIPVVGKLISRLIQGQLFQTLGMLIECKVGLLDAVELGRGVTGNRRFIKLVDDIKESVISGGQMSTALEKSGIINPSICHSVRIGEDSGNLGPAITFCAETLDEENSELISTMTRLIEPMILILMGFVVGTVAISLFLPLFDMTSAMG